MSAAWLVLSLLQTGETPASARASIETQGEIWVGQRVTLVVVLRTPGFFASAPAFDLPQVGGAILIEPEGRPVIGSETVDGTSCTTQRHEVAVYAARAGAVAIPGFPVRFESSPAYGKPSVEQRVTTTAVSFTATMPPGAEGLSTVITTTALTLNERWEPEPGGDPVRPGAAFTRTITVEALGVPAMVLPSLRIDPLAGLSTYAKPPIVEDRADRDGSTGRRVETVTYVCASPGTFSLPALALSWWDPDGRTLKRKVLAGRTITVVAPPPAAETPTAPATPRPWPWFAGSLTAFLMVAVIAPRVAAYWKRRREAFAESEPSYFAALEGACAASDTRAAYRALLDWTQKLLPDDPAPAASALVARAGDPDLAADIAALESALYGRVRPGDRTWSGHDLARRARRARVRLRQAQADPRALGGLPPLNPAD